MNEITIGVHWWNLHWNKLMKSKLGHKIYLNWSKLGLNEEVVKRIRLWIVADWGLHQMQPIRYQSDGDDDEKDDDKDDDEDDDENHEDDDDDDDELEQNCCFPFSFLQMFSLFCQMFTSPESK